MKKIEKKFYKNGFTFEEVKRVGEFAIFARYKEEFKEQTFHYETIVIKSHNGYAFAGVEVGPSEIYPSSSSWGRLGFTFNSYERAEEKLEQLIKLKNAR
jgi:hypothetical protein